MTKLRKKIGKTDSTLFEQKQVKKIIKPNNRYLKTCHNKIN